MEIGLMEIGLMNAGDKIGEFKPLKKLQMPLLHVQAKPHKSFFKAAIPDS